jgi:hypothetical protein
MQIFVRTPTSAVIVVECQPSDSVASIHQQIVGCDRLVFGAKSLECGSGLSLAEYGVAVWHYLKFISFHFFFSPKINYSFGVLDFKKEKILFQIAGQKKIVWTCQYDG